MKLPPPARGTVIRYAYLWAGEYEGGRDEAGKDRPALVLALSVRSEDGKTEVLALAITHHPPKRTTDAVVLPAAVKRRLGLDDNASWIVTTEANAFAWPGPDVRPVPGRNPRTVVCGTIPQNLLQEAARSFLANRRKQRARMVPRTS